MRGRRALSAVSCTAVVSLAVLTLGATPAVAAGPLDPCDPEPRGVPMRTEPWGQKRLDFQKAWAYTKGEGVLVAEIDSGVDETHPQLAGRVLPSVDLTDSRPLDCTGHGTRVAGIIVGVDLGQQGIVFTGVAPAATLLPIKQTDTANRDEQGTARLAAGIRLAADRHAKVVNISVATGQDVTAVREAVEYAQARDVLIVAAAGNENSGDDGDKKGPQYPANYPGVVSVAAIDEEGKRSDFSVTATKISVAAPGSKIISTAAGPQHGYTVEDGTSFATPYVAGVAALVRAYHPELTNLQVKHRLEVTADHTTEAGLGAGVVNPLQAVTAVLPEESTNAPARPTPAALPPLQPPREVDTHTRNLALAFAAGGGALSFLVLVGAVVIPRGRRRRWKPGQRPPTPDTDRTGLLLR